jgi:hypothetical protein
MQTDIHALSGIRTHDPSVRASEDNSCLRPRGHWSAGISVLVNEKSQSEYSQDDLEELLDRRLKYTGIHMMCCEIWLLQLPIPTTACHKMKTFLTDLQLVDSNMGTWHSQHICLGVHQLNSWELQHNIDSSQVEALNKKGNTVVTVQYINVCSVQFGSSRLRIDYKYVWPHRSTSSIKFVDRITIANSIYFNWRDTIERLYDHRLLYFP